MRFRQHNQNAVDRYKAATSIPQRNRHCSYAPFYCFRHGNQSSTRPTYLVHVTFYGGNVHGLWNGWAEVENEPCRLNWQNTPCSQQGSDKWYTPTNFRNSNNSRILICPHNLVHCLSFDHKVLTRSRPLSHAVWDDICSFRFLFRPRVKPENMTSPSSAWLKRRMVGLHKEMVWFSPVLLCYLLFEVTGSRL